MANIKQISIGDTVYNVKDNVSGYQTESQVNTAISTHNTSTTAHDDIREKIKDIELFKFPNAIIIGNPTIQSGQVSGFTTTSYMQFPFVVDVRNKNFEIDFCFTTGSNITTQQNILDSKFGLALAISNGRGLMAMSSNGTQWDIGSTSGTMTINANTTYYAKVTWDGTTYKTALSTDGSTYTDDMTLTSSLGLYPTTIYIGGGSSTGLGRTPNPFSGLINFNKCYLYVAGLLVWQGMDDAGLATRADVSLSNLDSVGQAKFDEKITANTAITGATHTKITYDSKGLVTAGADLTASDIPDLSGTYYLSTNPNNYISGITSSMVTTALGYIPYNSTNPNGYITSSGSITGSSGSCTGNAASATTLTGLTATVDELNYCDGVTSNIQTQLDSKQDPLTAGNAISLDDNTVSVSLFDKSKFTVVGTPTITDDGIASGFSSSNYITTQNITLGTGDWSIILSHITGATLPTNGSRILNFGSGNNYIIYYNNQITISLYDSSSTVIISGGFSVTTNTSYLIGVSYISGVYSFKYSSDNGNTWITVQSVTSSSTMSATSSLPLYIGISNRNTNPLTTGSIDLKQFSITVDGEEVFNGNKTIYSVLDSKSNVLFNAGAFTVFGSPTITDDGIASGFSSSSYITTQNITLGTGDWSIILSHITGATLPTNGSRILNFGSGNNYIIYYNNQITISLYDSSSTVIISGGFSVTTNTSYLIGVSYISGVYSFKYSSDNGNTWITVQSVTSSSTMSATSSLPLYIGISNRNTNPLTTGSIDLKQFSITVDGVEVFSGAMNNPPRYVVAKSDSSILPSWWTVYNDGWIEQGGNSSVSFAHGQVSITTLKTFANTNYSIQLSMGNYPDEGIGTISWNTKAVSSFNVYGDYNSSSTTCNFDWYACGY